MDTIHQMLHTDMELKPGIVFLANVFPNKNPMTEVLGIILLVAFQIQ